jgi:hypothetical protein
MGVECSWAKSRRRRVQGLKRLVVAEVLLKTRWGRYGCPGQRQNDPAKRGSEQEDSGIDHRHESYAVASRDSKYINTEDGRSRAERADDVMHPETIGLPPFDATMPGVTVFDEVRVNRRPS